MEEPGISIEQNGMQYLMTGGGNMVSQLSIQMKTSFTKPFRHVIWLKKRRRWVVWEIEAAWLRVEDIHPLFDEVDLG